MGQITTISVNDSSAVSHDFVPHSREAGVSHFEEKTSSSSLGYIRLGVSLRENADGSVDRFTMKMDYPIAQTQTINGVDSPTVVRVLRAKVEFTLPAGTTLTERKDLNSYVQNLLASTDIKDVCENLNNLY